MLAGEERDPEHLAREHQELAEGFRRYLLAIADRRLEQAERLLDGFAAQLTEHLEAEEGYWVPLFEYHFGQSKGFGAKLILEEHKVLERLLGALRFLVGTIASQKRVMEAQQVLVILEESFRFRGVMSHHHAREDNVMIPALKELPPEAEHSSMDRG
jgi:hemerythrin-like domain-containing protein